MDSMQKVLLIIFFFFLILIPPLLSWWIADYFHLKPPNTNIIVWLATAYPIWIAVLAGIFQILGIDIKSIFQNHGEKKTKYKEQEESKHISYDNGFYGSLLNISNHIYSPYVLVSLLAEVAQKENVSRADIQKKFYLNKFILQERVNKICEMGLVSLAKDDIIITEQGRVMLSFLSRKSNN